MRSFRVGSCVVAAVLIGIAAYLCLNRRSAEPERDETAPADNEKSMGEAFVFLDGKYVEAPYEVTSSKGWLLLNDTRLRKISEWPIRVDSPSRPEIPQDILKNAKSFDDLVIPEEKDAWHSRMARWIFRTYPDPATRESELKRFYESLPFVDNATVADKDTVCVALKGGGEKLFGICFSAQVPLRTEADVLKEIERSRTALEDGLAMGNTYLFFRNGLELSFGRIKAAKDLGLMVEVLGSDRTTREKLAILRRMTIVPEIEDKHVSVLATGFTASGQLFERIQQLLDSTGVQPRTLQDIPALTPKQRQLQRFEDRNK